MLRSLLNVYSDKYSPNMALMLAAQDDRGDMIQLIVNKFEPEGSHRVIRGINYYIILVHSIGDNHPDIVGMTLNMIRNKKLQNDIIKEAIINKRKDIVEIMLSIEADNFDEAFWKAKGLGFNDIAQLIEQCKQGNRNKQMIVHYQGNNCEH